MEELVNDNDGDDIQMKTEINFLIFLQNLWMKMKHQQINYLRQFTLQWMNDKDEEVIMQPLVSNDDTTHADLTDGDNDPGEENIYEEHFTREDEFNLRQKESSLKHS